MSWKSKLGYFIAGATIGGALATIASYAYIDYRIKQSEAKYQALVKNEFESARKEIRKGVDLINNDLEKKIDKEIKEVKDFFHIPDKDD